MSPAHLPLSLLHRTLSAALGLFLLGGAATTVHAADSSGAVYVMSNATSDNAVLVYARAADGALTYTGSVPTGGSGIGTGGDPLGSQGALTLGSGFLLAVNAGSNDVSLFAAYGSELRLLDKQASGGTMPVSVTVSGFHVYVLNAGGTPNISGFSIDPVRGELVPLPDSQRPLAGGTAAAPAEVRFNEDGDELLVTEKGTRTVDSYTVDHQGYASQPIPHAAAGITPFGFSITHAGFALVSEAASGSASSYRLGDDGRLTLVSGAVALGQRAPCWLVTSGDGRHAYTANAGSGSISHLAIAHGGALTLVDPAAASLAAPLDMAFSSGSRYLYVREGNGAVAGFRVAADGSLSAVASVSGIPAGAQGIAAR